MKKAILATKVGMTQIFNEDGVLTSIVRLGMFFFWIAQSLYPEGSSLV